MPTVSTEGKPRLFFSSNSADDIWRLKEKVIAVVESYLQGLDDLYGFSSKRIRNVVGDLEEVDVAFSSISDPQKIFEFVQVRDREDIEGRPWIEQLMGQRQALGIPAGIMVSTEGFSGQAIRLASNQGIPLRLLLPETEENTKKWFSSDTIDIRRPMVDIAKCSVLAKIGETVTEFQVDGTKTQDDSILVLTQQPHVYKAISLARVFDVDIIGNPAHDAELLAKIPEDGQSHNATVVCQYERPRIYLKVQGLDPAVHGASEGIFPVGAIVFFVTAIRQFIKASVTYRYKYLNAINREGLAEVAMAETELDGRRHYCCLVRHSCDGETCQVGGAFFQ